MKKDKRYFLKNLSCRISKIRSNNNIDEVRGPIATVGNESLLNKSPDSNGQVSYDEMIPGESWEEHYSSPKGNVNLSYFLCVSISKLDTYSSRSNYCYKNMH